jgi:hypothetical protein
MRACCWWWRECCRKCSCAGAFSRLRVTQRSDAVFIKFMSAKRTRMKDTRTRDLADDHHQKQFPLHQPAPLPCTSRATLSMTPASQPSHAPTPHQHTRGRRGTAWIMHWRLVWSKGTYCTVKFYMCISKNSRIVEHSRFITNVQSFSPQFRYTATTFSERIHDLMIIRLQCTLQCKKGLYIFSLDLDYCAV